MKEYKNTEEAVVPPKQNTEEVGHWSEPVKEFHEKLADAMLDYNFLTSEYTRGMLILDFAGMFAPSSNSLIEQKTSDGWYKIKGGLPPQEYGRLVGEQQWGALESKYQDEKYLVYDDEQEKDPVTQLYPEFELMFRDGAYMKIEWKKYKDDNQPKLVFEFKSYKEYNNKP